MVFVKAAIFSLLVLPSVLAVPTADPGLLSGIGDLLGNLLPTDASCPGESTYCGFFGTCRCESGKILDVILGQCHHPSYEMPQCGHGERAYCATNENSYCEYSSRRPQCYNTGANQAFCCRPENLHNYLHQHCPAEVPQCPATQHYSHQNRRCECPRGKVWRRNSCRYPVMTRPQCGQGQRACCGRSQYEWSYYDENHDYCSNNGRHITYCSYAGQERDTCSNRWTR